MIIRKRYVISPELATEGQSTTIFLQLFVYCLRNSQVRIANLMFPDGLNTGGFYGCLMARRGL